MYFYMSFVVQEPWKNDLIKLYVSGDDAVVICHPSLAEPLRESILQCSTRNREAQVLFLGQCIKIVIMSAWWDFDFCSLWSKSASGNPGDLTLMPNLLKTYVTK